MTDSDTAIIAGILAFTRPKYPRRVHSIQRRLFHRRGASYRATRAVIDQLVREGVLDRIVYHRASHVTWTRAFALIVSLEESCRTYRRASRT